MEIIRATYGPLDVTDSVKFLVKEGLLFFRVGNHVFGDPQPGTVKNFSLVYRVGNKEETMSATEGDHVTLPRRTATRLGVWYTYNPSGCETSTRKSLESIKKASDFCGADVVTCGWSRIPENPFVELHSWTKTLSHLNQVLQILQCLYAAKRMARYEYVSFLEHDVLYPLDYFKFPAFSDGEVITNMNYQGVCREGFQPRQQHDQPFHQMTMRFDDAIRHLESILPNAIHTNAGLVEPQNHKRLTWESQNPSVHINHGVHFTSHFRVYGQATSTTHPYWGDCTQYFGAK